MMIITIDGPVGTGKSTVAKKLAEKLDYLHFDTGAMYRCVTYGILNTNIDYENSEELRSFLDSFCLDVRLINGKKHYFFDGEDITKEIRGDRITSLVSKISAIKIVREKLVEIQQRLGENSNAVFEGRDMGTIVFPNADLKIFLTASPEVRAQRRYQELCQKFPEESPKYSFESILESIQNRDTYDSTREISPLKKAEDAYEIDTSHLTVEEVINKIINYLTN